MVDPTDVLSDDYAISALGKLAGIPINDAHKILRARDWRRRFEYVWELIDESEKQDALHYDYDFWENYWPGYDYFNRAFYENIYSPESSFEVRAPGNKQVPEHP